MAKLAKTQVFAKNGVRVMRWIFVVALISCCSCGVNLAQTPSLAALSGEKESVMKEQSGAIEILLDGFHQAASQADGERYFGYFHEDGVFIGTDKEERWTLQEFKAFADPYFSKGKGWTYVPGERHIMFSPAGMTAWFDEQLVNEKYGNTRGSGALIKVGDDWKLTHYVLSFPIPNDVAGEVVGLVQKFENGTK